MVAVTLVVLASSSLVAFTAGFQSCRAPPLTKVLALPLCYSLTYAPTMAPRASLQWHWFCPAQSPSPVTQGS